MYLVSDADDAALVSRSLTGDGTAFEALVARHERVLFTVACRFLGNRDDARDAVQGALIKAYEHLARFDANRPFFSWIYRILVNECLNSLRARRPQETIPATLAAVGTPFDQAAARERQAQVQRALLQLPPDSRAVIVLRHFAELSYDEISETLGIPEKTVKSRLYTARQRLGELLLGWRART